MAGPRFINQDVINAYAAAGIDPKTGKPTRASIINCASPDDFKKQLRILDEQQAINRYVWYNLPSGLTGQLIERILYYKGQAMFFWMNDDEETGGTFYFLPFALDGTIDVYGRFNSVTPLPFNGSAQDKKDAWIPGLTRKVIKEFPVEPNLDMFENGCVLLYDYCKQISQMNIPRQILQDPLLQQMSEIFPLVRTSLLANSGVKGMRVQNEDDKSNVTAANRSIAKAALNGEYFVPIVGTTEFQDLTDGGNLKAQEYLMTMEAYDNFRLQLYGLKNGGIFEKSQYVNRTAEGNIQQNCGLQYQDGLTLRQEFCDIVNSIWGTFIWCDTSEVVQNMDSNMDGSISDEQDQSGTMEGEQPEGGITE